MVPLAAKYLEQLERNLHSNVPPYPPLEGKQMRGQVMSVQGSGGGSLRQWRVLQAGPLAAYQVTTAADRAFQAMEARSKGKGSACVKPESFLHHVKPWCQDAQSWTKILFWQQVAETGFLLSTSNRQSRSRLIIMVSTYQGTLNKRTYHVFFSFLIYVHTEGLL